MIRARTVLLAVSLVDRATSEQGEASYIHWEMWLAAQVLTCLSPAVPRLAEAQV